MTATLDKIIYIFFSFKFIIFWYISKSVKVSNKNVVANVRKEIIFLAL